MQINNPPVFDTIIDENGVQIKPTVVSAGTGREQVTWDIDKPVLNKYIDIGIWNMDSTVSVTVNHGLDMSLYRILLVTVYIDDDAGTQTKRNLSNISNISGTSQGSVVSWNNTTISLTRLTGGAFDDAAYSSAVINRGSIYIEYALI